MKVGLHSQRKSLGSLLLVWVSLLLLGILSVLRFKNEGVCVDRQERSHRRVDKQVHVST